MPAGAVPAKCGISGKRCQQPTRSNVTVYEIEPASAIGVCAPDLRTAFRPVGSECGRCR
jgi:hypothetical protein